MGRLIYNLHNHTPFSDGAYTIDELCDAHLSVAGVEVDGIGVSDHLFITPSSRAPSDPSDFDRIFAGEVRSYVEQVKEARERWADRLDVLVGCEISWLRNKNFIDAIPAMLDGFDYVLFQHVDWAGLTQIANKARKWPCPIGLAHVDVPTAMPTTSLDQVVRTLANARIFYEYNARYSPLPEGDDWYNLLPRHRVTVSIGTDTHDDLSCLESIGDMAAYLSRRGLDDRLYQPRRKFVVPAPIAIAG